jgi:hypothetical protein
VRRRRAAATGTVAAVTSVSPRLSPDGAAVSLALVDLDDGIRIMARCWPQAVVGARVTWYFPPPDDAGQPPVPHVGPIE